MINIKIDGRSIEAENGEMLLDVAIRNGFPIPALCYHESVIPYGACRLCLVEIKKGKRTRISTSCNYPVLEEVEVSTNSENIKKLRKGVIRLLLSRCSNLKYVQDISKEYGITEDRFKKDDNGCILCGLCVRVCAEKIGKSAIAFINRGVNREVSSPFLEIADDCIGCGACAEVCPVDYIKIEDVDGRRKIKKWKVDLQMAKCGNCKEYFSTDKLIKHINDKNIIEESVVGYCSKCKLKKIAHIINGG